MTETLKPVLHYAFLACVLEEIVRDFASGNLQAFLLSEMMIDYGEIFSKSVNRTPN